MGNVSAGAGAAPLTELTAGEVAHGGWCVAREPGGRVVFVRHALPGERVLARITSGTARFARADAVQIVAPSPDRVVPRCPHARPGGCGGCDWQHASLAAQRRLKADVIGQQLRRFAGLDREVTVEPVPGDDEGLRWRTRVRFSVAPDGTAGLLAHRSHEVIAIGDCPIAHPLISPAALTADRWERAASVEVTVSPGSGERAVMITARAGRRRTVLGGREYLHQHAAGHTWRVRAGTFWQVHPGAADVLAAAVLDALRPAPGDVVLDLYCGAGLFAGVLAGAVGPRGTVIGLEGDRAAVRDARHNLRRWPWARVHHGDVASLLAQRSWPEAGLAVLDPPRVGAGRAVLERLLGPALAGVPGGRRPGQTLSSAVPQGPTRALRQTLRRVAYVSCDPATLARDIAVCAELGWELADLRAFDAFPMTHHVECLATLVPA